MGCPPLREDNPRALASGLSYTQAKKHGITIVYLKVEESVTFNVLGNLANGEL